MSLSRIPSLWPYHLAMLMLGLTVGCDIKTEAPQGPIYADTPPSTLKPIYRFAVPPLHTPDKLAATYQPLIHYLNRQINAVQFELETSRDYQNYEAKFRARGPEFLLPNPWQTLEAIKVGYHVFAMAGDPEDFKGLLLIRKDSGIQTPQDLRGKVISYPSPTALAACIMPQYFLHSQGLDVVHDSENRYVGSQESSIMNVYLGEAAAGGTWPPPWRLFQQDHPEQAAELKVAWETPPLLNNAVMARDDIPAATREAVQAHLLQLTDSAEGQAILNGMATARFHMADDDRYQIVRDYIAEFERTVRPVEQR